MKKHPTLKSINNELPRFDFLRRNYMLYGYTGMAYGYGFLEAAFANLDKDGNVESIRLYTFGEAMERRHYYHMDGVVDITSTIEMAIRGRYAEYTWLDARKFREMIVLEIQNIIDAETYGREE